MNVSPVPMPKPSSPAGPALFLFDGACGLCCRSVRFALRRSRAADVVFAALASPCGRAALVAHGLQENFSGSAVVVADGRAWTHSDSVWQLARRLRWPWRAAAALRLVPRFLREPAYAWVARHRLRLFGAGDACAAPRAGDHARFLDATANGP